ncbi:hypothetical protein QJS10_CPB11g00442 [Acorus calamus]|uniref:Ubiquitin-like domain-containing protein n=1 Tax=Acorus calamus TaxID=4465 RepID=A0AAV9DT63_ACOCL|nr:hypothetical protein QJS10_CPB11g00442 [Acorus calamus]
MIFIKLRNMAYPRRPLQTLKGEFHTVGELKQEIHRHCRIENGLLLVHDGKLMHDEVAHPSCYGVGDGALIDFHCEVAPYVKLTLMVEYRGDAFPVKVLSHRPIKDLKKAIHLCVGLPPHLQRLTYMGATMRDDDLLYGYLIEEDPTQAIHLTELPRDV